MENILVPCDFSKPAEEAFKFAVKIARQSKGVVHVLHVIDISFMGGNPSLDNSYAFNVTFLKEMEQDVEKRFAILRDRWAPGIVAVKFKHVISSLIPEVENYTRDNEIDLVVMGTSGTGGALIGSNTGRVIRHSVVPVISVHATSEKEIKNIVFPVMPDHNKSLVDEVKKLQGFFHAELHLLYVNTPLFLKPDGDAKKALQDFVQEFDIRNCTLNLRADLSIEKGITHFSQEIHADLIAMGTHAWKGVWHLIIGSVAEDIANHLPAPVWTYAIK